MNRHILHHQTHIYHIIFQLWEIRQQSLHHTVQNVCGQSSIPFLTIQENVSSIYDKTCQQVRVFTSNSQSQVCPVTITNENSLVDAQFLQRISNIICHQIKGIDRLFIS